MFHLLHRFFHAIGGCRCFNFNKHRCFRMVAHGIHQLIKTGKAMIGKSFATKFFQIRPGCLHNTAIFSKQIFAVLIVMHNKHIITGKADIDFTGVISAQTSRNRTGNRVFRKFP